MARDTSDEDLVAAQNFFIALHDRDDSPVTPEEVQELVNLNKQWYKSNDVNIKNLGIYLKNIYDGYTASVDPNANHGYIKFATYSRSFCECLCNILLQGKKQKETLSNKCKILNKRIAGFPGSDITYVREKTNKIVHPVGYNQDARHRFMSTNDERILMKRIYNIAVWLEGHIR